jgi:entericidin B
MSQPTEWRFTMGKKLLALTAALAALLLSACNTMQGAGKDIERGGEKVQDAAEKAK